MPQQQRSVHPMHSALSQSATPQQLRSAPPRRSAIVLNRRTAQTILVRQETRNFQPSGSDLKGRLSENRETLAGDTSADAKHPEEPAARNNQSPSTPLPWARPFRTAGTSNRPRRQRGTWKIGCPGQTGKLAPIGGGHDRAPAKTPGTQKNRLAWRTGKRYESGESGRFPCKPLLPTTNIVRR